LAAAAAAAAFVIVVTAAETAFETAVDEVCLICSFNPKMCSSLIAPGSPAGASKLFVINDCASRTRFIVSSMSFCCECDPRAPIGFKIGCDACATLTDEVPSKEPLCCKAFATLLCSLNSTIACTWDSLSDNIRTYLTSPISLKYANNCSPVICESKPETMTVRRVSSNLLGSRLAGKRGYCGSPRAVNLGSMVDMDCEPFRPATT
jgi:hypothetical protein